MANSGTLYTNASGIGLKIGLSWNISNINKEAGTATFNWSAFTDGPNGTASTISGDNYCSFNGTKMFNIGPGQTQGYNNALGTFSSNRVDTVYDFDGTPYTLYMYKYLGSGSRTVYYNDDGYCNFQIKMQMNIYGDGGSTSTTYTINLDRIDRYNKSKKTSNSGVSWQDASFWKTTDYGATWSKCKGWKTTNSGATWTKV